MLALAAVGLAGCVTAKNTLSRDDIATLRLAGVDVSFAPNVHIWWGDGERAFAASKGQPATESEILAKTPEGQAYLRNTIAVKVKGAMERKLSGELVGTRPVRVQVTVKAFVVASAIQRVIIGGHHSMTADVTLVDAKSGVLLLPYAGQWTQSGAGQGIGGVLVDAALLPDPIDRVVDNYASTYGFWLSRKEPPDLAGSSG
ncbi:MAG: hypothetical protein WCE79_26040 [Xanthobacteraceae bacterium]